MASTRTDETLINLVAAGHQGAFAELVNRHTDQLFKVAYFSLHNKADAEDVVQSTFIKLWQRPQLWNPRKSQLSTWLHRVVINACHDLRRRGAKQLDMADDTLLGVLETTANEELSDSPPGWQQQYLEDAITELTQPQRDALNLVVYAELSQREAAEVLKISVKALESLLVRAKRKISQIVQQRMHDTGAKRAGAEYPADTPSLVY